MLCVIVYTCPFGQEFKLCHRHSDVVEKRDIYKIYYYFICIIQVPIFSIVFYFALFNMLQW